MVVLVAEVTGREQTVRPLRFSCLGRVGGSNVTYEIVHFAQVCG